MIIIMDMLMVILLKDNLILLTKISKEDRYNKNDTKYLKIHLEINLILNISDRHPDKQAPHFLICVH